MSGAWRRKTDSLDRLVRRVQIPRRKKLLRCRGHFAGRGVLVFGRTGAGKSSLINRLCGRKALEVGDVGSTTREIQGVCSLLYGAETTLVDTPGIGEAGTDQDYRAGMLDWLAWQERDPDLMLLVLQADAKAYADEKRFLLEMRRACPQAPVLVVVNQVDKLKPTRAVLSSSNWQELSAGDSVKGKNIAAKLRLVAHQFELSSRQVLPLSVSDEKIFNLAALEKALAVHLGACGAGMFSGDAQDGGSLPLATNL